MSWKETYKSRITTAEKAIKAIKDNDYVVFSETAGIPQLIAKTLADHREDYHNVHIYHMLTLGDAPYLKPECYGHFHHITNFVGGNSRQALLDQKADFIPCYFKDVPAMLGEAFPVDVAVVSVSNPDNEGYCSFGVSCDYAKAATQKAKTVIAEINEMTPHTFGVQNKIHVSEIDYIVPCAYNLPEIPNPTIGEVEKNIGKHCASLIKDGATLQLGIGAIPDAVLLFLGDKRDLGIHTEMFSDGVVDLVEEGVINNAKKTLHRGKLVSTFIMGTRKVYNFIDNNPNVCLYPVDYVNDPWVIGQNDNMVSINSCIEVDLMGQVASETLGLKQFSGTGGQVDFVRGAALSKGGISIMAMPSTAAKGKASRIVPLLAEGAAVTTPRNDVDYIVTEYGIAKMKGKTLRERAQNLIAIAHPDFRAGLEEAFETRFGTK
ncbi:MAG: acetyl-CoA hydrolase/transferase family protein [Bacteroidales bacterium]|nr:acetyl-CoA hydrolase/transferase family protein [Bacteroidales bacterium]